MGAGRWLGQSLGGGQEGAGEVGRGHTQGLQAKATLSFGKVGAGGTGT